MTVNTLIVDDIRLSRDGLSMLLKNILPEINIIGSVASVSEARKVIKSKQIDLVFLDIQLQDGTSFELIDDIPFDTKVVFITAYDKHAIEAIRKGAFDYLLKPVNVAELKNCIKRIKDIGVQSIEAPAINPVKEADLEPIREIIGISSMDGIDYVRTDDILYLKADGKYTEIHLKNETFTSSKNLKVFEYLLPNSTFMRVHHSFLVNLKAAKRFKKDDNILILMDGAEVPVSKSRKDLMMSRLIHV